VRAVSIGGSAFNCGIHFISDNYRVKLMVKDNENFTVATEKRIKMGKIRSLANKIPLVKGVVAIFDGNPLIAVVLALSVINDFLSVYLKKDSLATNIILSTATVFLVVYFIRKIMINIKNTWRYHGAEHKTIYAYEHGMALTVENVRACPRTAKRCGTNLAVFMLLFFVIGCWLPVYPSIVLILSFVLAYEVFDLKNGDKLPVISLFYKLGYILQQHVFTLEPSDFQIRVSIQAISRLIELERTGKK
jgi:uncharacterized protein YqhQ